MAVPTNVRNYYNYRPNSFQAYGASRDGGARRHRGTDFSHSTRPGTLVPALITARVTGHLSPASWHGFGYQITTEGKGPDGRTYRVSYAHGSKYQSNSGTVNQGQYISTEGTTGATSGSCMHLEVYDVAKGKFIDPMILVKMVLASSGGSTSGGSSSSKPKPNAVLSWKWTGLQRMLRSDFNYNGRIDNIAGRDTVRAFQRFMNFKGYSRRAIGRNLVLDGNWGINEVKSMQVWLKAKHGYTGPIDAVPGLGTKAAFSRAEVANGRVYR